MGKASSAKKVARAARAGGNRRPGQRRALGFPAVVAAVLVLGTSMVLFARSSREANAEPRSQADGENADHWHAAYGFAFCGDFVYDAEGEQLVDVGQDALGIHTHGDGVIHIHPFIDSAAGRNARLGIFFDQVDLQVSDSLVTFPDGTTWDESEDRCEVDGEDVAGQLVVARWRDSQNAADGEKPDEIFTEDFGAIRFRNDREYFTIAFVPEDDLENIPIKPGILTELANLTDIEPNEDLEAPPDSVADPSSTTVADGESTSTTSAEGDTTSTTAADGESPSTTASEGDTTSTTAAG